MTLEEDCLFPEQSYALKIVICLFYQSDSSLGTIDVQAIDFKKRLDFVYSLDD